MNLLDGGKHVVQRGRTRIAMSDEAARGAEPLDIGGRNLAGEQPVSHRSRGVVERGRAEVAPDQHRFVVQTRQGLWRRRGFRPSAGGTTGRGTSPPRKIPCPAGTSRLMTGRSY